MSKPLQPNPNPQHVKTPVLPPGPHDLSSDDDPSDTDSNPVGELKAQIESMRLDLMDRNRQLEHIRSALHLAHGAGQIQILQEIQRLKERCRTLKRRAGLKGVHLR